MSDSTTQEEINEIMKGLQDDNKDILPAADNIKWKLTETEKDALGEIGNICMGASATTLYSLLNRRVSITTPQVSVCDVAERLGSYKKPYVAVVVSYTDGVHGINVFLLKQEDALLITDLLMGGDGSGNSESNLSEFYLSAISEVMNQMVGSSSTSLADILHVPINISPPVVKEIIMDEDNMDSLLADSEAFIKISFSMEIEGLLVSEIMQILPFSFGKALANSLINEEAEKYRHIAGPAAQSAQQAPAASSATPSRETPVDVNENGKVGVKSVQYQSFDDLPMPEPAKPAFEDLNRENIDLIMDVPLHVTVELGKAKKSIKEILGLKMGSIIVLDRLAGEMVDVLVNGKLFARGEVVVIDDSYGVRVTEIIESKRKS